MTTATLTRTKRQPRVLSTAMSRRQLERAHNWQCTISYPAEPNGHVLIRCLMRAEHGRYYWHVPGDDGPGACHAYYADSLARDLRTGQADLLHGVLPVDIRNAQTTHAPVGRVAATVPAVIPVTAYRSLSDKMKNDHSFGTCHDDEVLCEACDQEADAMAAYFGQ